ncbi:hypothetical protein JZ751_020917 [Albula glossodonta]|uniref:Ubiquitin carboxyl-terminal hydrolase n=1 Tax=Albula glossodonta TaxID=121402 RepID=A0A8T2PGP7_9TELE|nr:hypothetical protein JZ751_020917 [Albula glossodonta]
MASHSNQYIFGEFSPDEFNQFFVTPRCHVELPPFNDKVSSVSQSSGTSEFTGCLLSRPGEDYQHIEFGVDEVMGSEPVRVKESLQKVSSTLNPQAPEFILGCQPSLKSVQGLQPADEPDGTANFNSVGCTDSELPLMDGGGVCQDLEGAPGSLGQRERKKKKKRPPGYYNYLEGSSGGGGSSSTPHSEAPLGAGLVNGHVPSASSLGSESDLTGETVPGATPLSRCAMTAAPLRAPTPSGPELAQPTATTDQEEGRDPAVPNGPTDPVSSGGTDEHKDSPLVGEPQSLSPQAPVAPPSLGPEAQPVAEQAQSPVPISGAPAPKSWASLFHNSKPLPGGPQAYVEVKNVPVAVVAPPPVAQTPEMAGDAREGPVHVSEDAMAPKLAELIENVKLIHKPVSLQPRGLINKGNWCYINATLQALVACPPMYHLMKSIPALSESQRPCSSTPMIDNFVRLVNEFSNMPVPSKAKQQAAGDKVMKDIRPGVPFEPNYIYRLLTVIKSSLSEKGRQEDAEEYLGFILNGLHEEMLALKKLLSPQEDKASTLNGPESQPKPEEDSADREEDGSEDEWEQVGPRNKTSVTRQADFIRTPITDIFGGHIRSVVYQHSSKESATLQPFFTLQLDIQSEKTRTVQEALEALVARESVQGYTTKTKQEIEISRRVTLEELPPVLVLHLKRFVFEKTGGCQKLVKNIDYPVDLEISKDLLSPGVRSKIFKGQRTYRLFAVVYHHGNSATGGHYTTDVFHIGLNGWLRIDDQVVKVITQYQVVKQTAERTAYLLYYRRVDLL